MNQPWIYMCSPSRSPLPPPSPTHPTGSSQCTSPEHLSHASNLDWRSVSHLIKYTCFNAVLSDHPTLAFSLRVQKSVLYSLLMNLSTEFGNGMFLHDHSYVSREPVTLHVGELEDPPGCFVFPSAGEFLMKAQKWGLLKPQWLPFHSLLVPSFCILCNLLIMLLIGCHLLLDRSAQEQMSLVVGIYPSTQNLPGT